MNTLKQEALTAIHDFIASDSKYYAKKVVQDIMDRTNKKRYAASLFLMILAPVVLFPSHACAYIDPNTGGYVFQILFPVLSAIAGMFLFFRNTIKQLLGRLFSKFHKK